MSAGIADFAPAEYVEGLTKACERFEISTPMRIAMFLANVAEETQGFERMTESFNYSSERLLAEFGKHISASQAQLFGRHDGENIVPIERQQQIANQVYAFRFGNGSPRSGDGWRYRGRYAGLTFRDNYARASMDVFGDQRLVSAPDQVSLPVTGALAAASFFRANGCNSLADAGDFVGVCKRFNPAGAGLLSRQSWFDKSKQAMGV